MKQGLKKIMVIGVFLFASKGTAWSEPFVSGSTGAEGEFSPVVNTELQLPPDGIFNFTTVNIPSGITVTFKKNAANTPVYMLATGDITVAGTINLNGGDASSTVPGKGGTGGFDGGGNYPLVCSGSGLGPGGGGTPSMVPANFTGGNNAGGGGGGFAGGGGIGQSGVTFPIHVEGGKGGSTYGNSELIPMIGGSGGGGGCVGGSALADAGGGGGGAFLIASSGTINITGTITTNGGSGSGVYRSGGAGGSGGAIKIMANILKGEGAIKADGGPGGTIFLPVSRNEQGAGGSSGRIRIEVNTLLRASLSSPIYSFSNNPKTAFTPVMPSLKITSIGGNAVSAAPTGGYTTPDITITPETTNPVTVAIEASNIPLSTAVKILVVPQTGTSFAVTANLSGTEALSTATADINLTAGVTAIVQASAVFNK